MTFLYRLMILLTPTWAGRSSVNSLFHARYKKDSPHVLAVKFQEQVESAFKKLLILPPMIVMIGLGLYTGYDVEFGCAAIVFMVAAVMFTTSGWGTERIELRGQSVESYLRWRLYGEDYDSAEYSNGVQLSQGSYADRGAFKGMTPDEIAAELRKWRPWAARMCKALVKGAD